MDNYRYKLKHANIKVITNEVVVPLQYSGETNFIINDQIVTLCCDKYGLLQKQINILDPMCGLGTIPRVINKHGGQCLGVEIDELRFKLATQSTNNDSSIIHGDFLKLNLPNTFKCIFTSLPFIWFKDANELPSVNYAQKFKKLLSVDGFILLDSVPIVDDVPVAYRQCDYLEKNGFLLTEIIKFHYESQNKNYDESIIMKFEPKYKIHNS